MSDISSSQDDPTRDIETNNRQVIEYCQVNMKPVYHQHQVFYLHAYGQASRISYFCRRPKSEARVPFGSDLIRRMGTSETHVQWHAVPASKISHL